MIKIKLTIREDSVEIEGYVNAIERNSKPLISRTGEFVERICKGAFFDALKRNDDVHVLLNHDWKQDLGSTKQGNLKLEEDSIGLHAKAVITDKKVIEDARAGKLTGWSFGFQDRDVENGTEEGLPLRKVKAMDLYEVSILNQDRSPAYEGTLINARAKDDYHFYAAEFSDEIKTEIETRDTEKQAEPVDYSKYETMIEEMKGDSK